MKFRWLLIEWRSFDLFFRWIQHAAEARNWIITARRLSHKAVTRRKKFTQQTRESQDEARLNIA
jgi:hypothetical protein